VKFILLWPTTASVLASIQLALRSSGERTAVTSGTTVQTQNNTSDSDLRVSRYPQQHVTWCGRIETETDYRRKWRSATCWVLIKQHYLPLSSSEPPPPVAAHRGTSWSENITRLANEISRAVTAEWLPVTDIRLRVNVGRAAAPFLGPADITHHVTSCWLVRRQHGQIGSVGATAEARAAADRYFCAVRVTNVWRCQNCH